MTFPHGGDEAQADNNHGRLCLDNGVYERTAACFQRATELRTSFYADINDNLKKVRQAIGGASSPRRYPGEIEEIVVKGEGPFLTAENAECTERALRFLRFFAIFACSAVGS